MVKNTETDEGVPQPYLKVNTGKTVELNKRKTGSKKNNQCTDMR